MNQASNRERGDVFARRVGEYLSKRGHVVRPEYPVDVGFNSRHKRAHRFDYGNESLLVECQFYDWTEGGNNPSAKISTLNESMMFFYSAPATYKKMVFISKTEKKGVRQPETFGEYYVRLNKHFIPDGVEVWEFDASLLTARQISAEP
jgi:hypothetical protein